MTLAYLTVEHERSNNAFLVPRGETRWGDGGALEAVRAPLTPRPRGTNYEALPFILEHIMEAL